MTISKPRKKAVNNRSLLYLVIGIWGVLAVGLVILAMLWSKQTAYEDEHFPTQTAAPRSATKAKPIIPDAKAAVRKHLGERLIDYSYDPAGVIVVTWRIEVGLTDSLIRASARRDAAEILRRANGSSTGFNTITMLGIYALEDSFGNREDATVVALTFKRMTINKINWDNFLPENIYDIADEAKIHPAFDQ